MSELRIHIKVGDREVEIQGTSNEVDRWVKELLPRLGLDKTPPQPSSHTHTSKTADAPASVDGVNTEALAQKVQEDSRWPVIYDKILRQRSALNCEVLALYFADRSGLAGPEINATLKSLGRDILSANITRDLSASGSKYVTKRKDGKNYRFTINPTGREFIEQLINL